MTYPYIKDRNMYRAVMFACKMIRDDGYFNKAVDYADFLIIADVVAAVVAGAVVDG